MNKTHNTTSDTPVFENSSLANLLSEAYNHTIENGIRHDTSRGSTYSAGTIVLVWDVDESRSTNTEGLSWSKSEYERYLECFVRKTPINRPQHLPLSDKTEYIFPYKYAERSRYWDNGWGYALKVINATNKLGLQVESFCSSLHDFQSYVTCIGEQVHIQTVLSVLSWLGKDMMSFFIDNQTVLESIVERSECDQLDRIIKEIEGNPASRRAITSSFLYPTIDQQLYPTMGVPPYQNFQLLPRNSDKQPLSSLHYHRSLDAGDGVQLDFMHDLSWLHTACYRLSCPVGKISIVAGDFHVYVSSLEQREVSINTGIMDWLMKVTDGYKAGSGYAKELMQSSVYQENSTRIFNNLNQ